jgi:hypothetical protein
MSTEQAMEAAEFHRGPHDGLLLKMEEIHSWCRLVRAKKGDELRLFAMMPSPSDWGRVVSGKLAKDGPFDKLYAYELVKAGDVVAFIFCRHDEFSDAAGEFIDEA